MSAQPTKPVFVVFEGLDGSGKSTCAQETAKLLGADYLTTPLKSLQEFRKHILDSFGDSQEAVQLFYLATVFAAELQAKRSLKNGVSVVLDRYFLSTQVYAEYRGSGLDLDNVGKVLLPPNLTVYLDAPLKTRHERLTRRGATSEDNETLSVHADSELRQAYARRSGHPVVGTWLTIDAAIESPTDVAKCVIANLHT